MLEAWKDFRRSIYFFLENQGIDVVYLTAGFMLVLSLVALKRVKRWNKLDEIDQRLLKAIFFATAVAVLGSILHLFGVF